MSKGFYTVNLDGSASGRIPAPVIGENGNWWIGNEDTGISANGRPGPKGEKGDQGEQGPGGPKGDNGQAADMSRVETLEKQMLKLNSGYKIKEAGTVTIPSIAAASNAYADVDFEQHYDVPPLILTSVQASTSTQIRVSCEKLTATGVRIYVRNDYTSAISDVIIGYAIL